jgi:predicted glutamine amidotransferase
MSRMLAFASDRPVRPAIAIGTAAQDAMTRMSALHADGWGLVTRTTTGELEVRTSLSAFAREGLAAVREAAPATAGILYLRFASRGAAVSPENLQPFVRGRTAFAHNGALSPREEVADLLSPAERADLRGTTDSEAYFAVVRRELARSDDEPAAALARAVARVREAFPTACLNALVIHGDGVWVVHAPGTVAPPHPAFAARGWSADDLPPGHGDDYNVLSVQRSTTSALVSTAGLGGTPLPRDTISSLAPAR